MTTRKHLKRRARSRAARTGESYATALRMIRAQQENRMPSSPDPVLAACSFCGKPDTAVQRLVAGPGVYICDECILLSASIVQQNAQITPEEAAGRRAEYYDRSSAEILLLLPGLMKSADRISKEMLGWIRRLRERGTDWPVIAEAMGLDVETVRQRFEPE